MNGEQLREHLQPVLPLDKLADLAKQYGAVKRERQPNIVQLVIALVLSGGTHQGGRQ